MTNIGRFAGFLMLLISQTVLGQTEIVPVNRDANGRWFEMVSPALSGNGRYVAFASRESFFWYDANGVFDIYRLDLDTGAVQLVSEFPDGSGEAASGSAPSISDDGRYVAYLQYGSDWAGEAAIVRDMETGSIEAGSLFGTNEHPNDTVIKAVISGNGRHLAFVTPATNGMVGLVSGPHAWVRSLDERVTRLVDVDHQGVPGNQPVAAGPADGPWLDISDDGSRVAFVTRAGNFEPALSFIDKLLVKDLVGGGLYPAAPIVYGSDPASWCVNVEDVALSGDGLTVGWTAHSSGNYAYTFVRDLRTGEVVSPSNRYFGLRSWVPDVGTRTLDLSRDGRMFTIVQLSGAWLLDSGPDANVCTVDWRQKTLVAHTNQPQTGLYGTSPWNVRVSDDGSTVLFAWNGNIGFGSYGRDQYVLSRPVETKEPDTVYASDFNGRVFLGSGAYDGYWSAANIGRWLDPPSAAFEAKTVGDFNRDSRMDVVYQNPSTREVRIGLIDRTGLQTFANVAQTPDAGWDLVGAGDFTGAGSHSLVFQRPATRSVAIAIMDGVRIVQWRSLSQTPNVGWRLACVGDWNGDGLADVLFQNDVTYSVSVAICNGATVTNWSNPAPSTQLKLQEDSARVVGFGSHFKANGDRELTMLSRLPSKRQLVSVLRANGSWTHEVRIWAGDEALRPFGVGHIGGGEYLTWPQTAEAPPIESPRPAPGNRYTLAAAPASTPLATIIGQSRMTPDGRYVVYASPDAVPSLGDTNGVTDIFRYDRVTGTTILVSRLAAGGALDGSSVMPSISDDGRLVAFSSFATNLIPAGANGILQAYVIDVDTAAVRRLSSTPNGEAGNAASTWPSISGDGSTVAFESVATDLATETPDLPGVYWTRTAGGPLYKTIDSPGTSPRGTGAVLDYSGKTILFSGAVPGGSERRLRLWATSSGSHLRAQPLQDSVYALDDLDVRSRDICSDGTNVFAVNAHLGSQRMVRLDALTGWISPGATSTSGSLPWGNYSIGEVRASSNGRFVAFSTDAPAMAPFISGTDPYEAYVYDSLTGSLRRATVALTGSRGPAWVEDVSDDGYTLLMTSTSDFGGNGGRVQTLWVVNDQRMSGDALVFRDAATRRPIVGEISGVASPTIVNLRRPNTGSLASDAMLVAAAPRDAASLGCLWYQSPINRSITMSRHDGMRWLGNVTYPQVPNPGWVLVGAGDFGARGKSSVLFQNPATRQVSIMLLDGAAVAGWQAVSQVPNAGWKAVAIADMNADSQADILYQHEGTGRMTCSFLNGPTVIGWANLTQNPNPGWRLAATGEFDGDSRPDLVFQNANGAITIALCTGLTVDAWRNVSGAPGSRYRVVGAGAF